jgi:hypothetical protein
VQKLCSYAKNAVFEQNHVLFKKFFTKIKVFHQILYCLLIQLKKAAFEMLSKLLAVDRALNFETDQLS